MLPENRTSSFRVMTYNVRFDTIWDCKNRWARRKNRLTSLISFNEPDLFGVQEPLSNQVVDLRALLPAFDWYGVGRDDGKAKSEFNAIFYRSDRFELLDKGTFWLSETPDIPGSKGWNAAKPRICSWVKLRDRRTVQVLYHFNTHLDHKSEIARRESARLILTRIQEIAGSTTPVILTSDLNIGPDSDAYRTIVTNDLLQDAKKLTETPHNGPDGTWATFSVGKGLGERIDYIFVTSKNLRVLQHTTLTDSNSECFPSDHLPVITELVVKNSSQID